MALIAATGGPEGLLVGLLKRNRKLQDLDLAATDLDSEGASALVDVLEFNTSLTKLHLAHNPALDEACKVSLEGAANKWRHGAVSIEFT